MKAHELTDEHLGHRITFTNKYGHHSFVLGHVHIDQTADGPGLVLLRAQGADPWDGQVIDGRRHIELSQP